jgi:hypothetical protein
MSETHSREKHLDHTSTSIRKYNVEQLIRIKEQRVLEIKE